MYPDDFIDIVRQDAYPDGSPEGPDYERARVREALEFIGHIKADKTGSGLEKQVAAEEVLRVFRATWRAAGLPDPVRW